MKKTMMLVLAVLMVLPMLFSCQGNSTKSTVYGTEEKAVKVTVIIENPDYVPPTTEAPEGEEPEVDVENPEFFFNGTVELYVKEPTIKDALSAAFMLMDEDKLYAGSIDDDNAVTIQEYADTFNSANSVYWEYTINDLKAEKSITAETLKDGQTLKAVFTSFKQVTTEAATQEATAEK